MKKHFYAMLSRMKNIYRWGLMRNCRRENLCEHSLEVAYIAHALCIIKNRRLGGNVNSEHIAVAAMYHDASEIITGDMPTPVKYYSDEIKTAYKEIEGVANKRLLSMLPDDLRCDYAEVFSPDDDAKRIIKAADKISALIKCTEELGMGNREFSAAEKATRKAIADMNLPEANIFLDEFFGSYSLSLDEQS